MKIHFYPATRVGLALLTLFGLFACQSSTTFFVGRTVGPNLMIPLTNASSQKGTWQTFDMKIDYDLRTDSDTLVLTGEAELGEHYRRLYNRVGHLDLYLFLLDEQASVLKTVEVSGRTMLTTEETLPIHAEILRSEDLRALSFGYRGSVTSLDSQASFDELP